MVDGKVWVDGKPGCSRCARRPKRWDGRRWQSLCDVCHREDARERRRGKIEVLLTPAEWAAVQAMRAAAAAGLVPTGRHRR